jgi:hypothetical protein
MSCLSKVFCCLIFLGVVADPTPLMCQTVSMGDLQFPAGAFTPQGVETRLQLAYPANLEGQVTTATFEWSASCPGVKIKFFRPSTTPVFSSLNPLPASFSFVTERGPFDVTAPFGPSEGFPFVPTARQTVALSPPVDVRAGDVIALTNLGCGAPMGSSPHNPPGFPPGLQGSFSVPGDVVGSVSTPITRRLDVSINVSASGTSPALGLFDDRGQSFHYYPSVFGDRFAITLSATDPRTGMTASGVPNRLTFRAGYFSLPAFTGDSTFPEVIVKMADATLEPELGGDFWFFHAPLTDLQYTLTVKDQLTGAVRTYSNTSGSPGQLCGGVDTSAFPGPPSGLSD